MARLDVDRFLETLSERPSRFYFAALQKLLLAVAMQDQVKRSEARQELAEVLAETLGVAEVVGATTTLQKAAALMHDNFHRQGVMPLRRVSPYDVEDVSFVLAIFAGRSVQSIIPRVTLREALEDMVERTPAVMNAAQRTAAKIAELYSADRMVAFVQSAELAVTQRVQALIAEAIKEGIPEAESGRLIQLGVEEVRKRTEAWTASYAKMAFRTNVNTAVTAGRFRQVQDPAVRKVIPAFRFDAVGDSDTRDNHRAADGIILKVDNPEWNKIAPPLGYNCRCQVSFVGTPELRRLGRVTQTGDVREDRVPSGAHPDPGFRHGGRPDLFGLRRT